ncbi:hypothetical protein Pfo_025314 [Paulownia fortunei]|nr:hypothetical protein Pfo_025314 [Paulownia fortunei]
MRIREQQLKLPRMRMEFLRCCFGVHAELLLGLVFMEDRFAPGKPNVVKNCYLPAIRWAVILYLFVAKFQTVLERILWINPRSLHKEHLLLVNVFVIENCLIKEGDRKNRKETCIIYLRYILRNKEISHCSLLMCWIHRQAIFKPPAAVRGGIPICFPQFGNRGSLEQHGFARNRMWVIDDNPPPLQSTDSIGKAFIDLLRKSSDVDLRIWPHSYEFRLRVILNVDGYLTLISRIRNVNCKPFSFSFAYHTYFSVSDISEVRVEGLETLDYLDNLRNRERFTEQGDALTFESEVDRVYLSSSDAVAVFDHEKKRTFVIRKEGFPDVVVWNPWDKKSRAIADFGDEEYKHMLCVDAAAIEKPITLKPGEEWTGRVELSVMTSIQ